MKVFARMQKLNNVTGRVDYISRQGKYSGKGSESLVYFQDDFSRWKELAEFEKVQPSKTNQARELIIALPNQMATLPMDELIKQTNLLASAVIKDQPKAFALHWNDKKNNFHMHLLFSERLPTEEKREPKTYRQDIWAKSDGTMAHKKEDRHHIMHKKGEIQRNKDGSIKYKTEQASGFTEKNTMFKTKKWYEHAKMTVKTVLSELGYKVTKFDSELAYLANKRYSRGNSIVNEYIKIEQEEIKAFNANVEKAYSIAEKNPEYKKEIVHFLKDTQQRIIQDKKEKGFKEGRIQFNSWNIEDFIFEIKEKINHAREQIAKGYSRLAGAISRSSRILAGKVSEFLSNYPQFESREVRFANGITNRTRIESNIEQRKPEITRIKSSVEQREPEITRVETRIEEKKDARLRELVERADRVKRGADELKARANKFIRGEREDHSEPDKRERTSPDRKRGIMDQLGAIKKELGKENKRIDRAEYNSKRRERPERHEEEPER
jgi:hypothetical protein